MGDVYYKYEQNSYIVIACFSIPQGYKKANITFYVSCKSIHLTYFLKYFILILFPCIRISIHCSSIKKVLACVFVVTLLGTWWLVAWYIILKNILWIKHVFLVKLHSLTNFIINVINQWSSTGLFWTESAKNNVCKSHSGQQEKVCS